MTKFRLSRFAENDLLDIGQYTLETWGIDQARKYHREIKFRCQLLADNPGLGSGCDYIRPRLRRIRCGRHVIYFREIP